MKKNVSILFLALLVNVAMAQVSKTINMPTSGTLSTLLTATEKTTITNLTITGNIDATDVKCMRNEITKLSVLDISAVTINAYNGNGGTSSSVSYPANEMPAYSFYNTFTGAGKTTLTSISMPTSINSIGQFTFKNCTGLTNIKIPDAVTSMGQVIFENCTRLTNVIIPNFVTSIGGIVFGNCTGLTTVTIGSSVNNLGSQVFVNCENLKTIYSLNPTPPVLGYSCFGGLTGVTDVYVPATSVSAYKAALGWSDSFVSVIKADNLSSTYGITVQIGSGGIVKENNISLADGSLINVIPSTTKTFSFTPIVGYQIATLRYNSVDITTQIVGNQFTTPSINANATLSVTFKKIQYVLSLKSAESGTIDLLCDYGTTPSFKFTPITGWKVNTLSYNGVDVTSSIINDIYTLPLIAANALLNVSFINTANGAPEVINNNIKVYTTATEIIIDGTNEKENITLYTVNGKQLQTIKSQGERITIPVQPNTIYVVKTQYKIYKVIL